MTIFVTYNTLGSKADQLEVTAEGQGQSLEKFLIQDTMFEAHVLNLLKKYLGEYVRGLSIEALQISVWKGDVVLKDLQLKAEALNALKLPLTVKAGFLGSVTLKVPWNKLGKEPVIVLLDKIFILAEPLQDVHSSRKEDRENWYEAKRRRVENAELAMLEAKDKKTASTEESPERSSWLGSLIATIVGNLKISITNLHIRYEDSVSNPGHPFCAGITLATLAAVTVDELGVETFVTSGALDKLCKSLQLQRLALYHDSDSKPWELSTNWESLTPQQWSEIFLEGISLDLHKDSSLKYSGGRQYLLHPVDGVMRYNRRGKREKRDANTPVQELSVVLDQVSLTLSEVQYCDGMKLLESFSRYRTRMQYAQLRPQSPVSASCRAWWLYACQAVLQQQRKIWYRFSWQEIIYLCQLRKKYVPLYASCLQQSPKVNNADIRKWDEELDVEVILLWRFLAHAKVESTKSKELARERERQKKSVWWSLGWGNTTEKQPAATAHVENEPSESEQLTDEEWKTLNELMSYKPGEEASQEAANMLQITYSVTIQRSAARVLDRNNVEILCGTFVNLQVGLRMYPKTVQSELRLQFYGLSAPEGPLLESVIREGREHALTTTFVHSPFDENLDWKLSATMSPIHVTVWRASFDRFLSFLRSARAISPDVVLETAAALQSKLEEVTRRAQEQLQLVLEQKRRFSVCLDLDAPKIGIPGEMIGSSKQRTQLLVDLGHFKLHTADDNVDGKDVNDRVLYTRFHIAVSDISAFLADGPFEWSEAPCDLIGDVDMEFDHSGGQGRQIFPVLDRCGMSVVLDQIQVPHPSCPSTRVAIQVPHVGLHFSPARYERLMCLWTALSGSDHQILVNDGRKLTEPLPSWHPGDHAGDLRVLLWGGIGSTVAEWQSRWGILAGPYLYVLESDTALTYQRCFSLVGKQVIEIPPSVIGGSENVIAVCSRGLDLQKAIESTTSVVMQLRTDEARAVWQNHLTHATYKSAAPVALSLSDSLINEVVGPVPVSSKPSQQLNLFVAGSLDELQIFISGTTTYVNLGSSTEERLIAELQAYGGKVDVLQKEHDMAVNMKLHSLKVEDKLQGHVSPSCQYIVRSDLPLKVDVPHYNSTGSEQSQMENGTSRAENAVDEEDESFGDALPEFTVSSPDSYSSTPRSLSSGSVQRKGRPAPGFTSQSSLKSSLFWRTEFPSLLKAEALLSQGSELVEEDEAADFVRIRICFREFASTEYDGTDTQISIRVATLDFFCNRPTVVTLIEFGCALSDISLADVGEPLQGTEGLISSPEFQTDSAESKGRDIVRGLLGRGKSRVIFRLRMDMETARIFLNKEDGSVLAMLAQEKFQMDLKVYPGSFTIAGTLGNLRVCDMFLGPEHQWGWFCDIRDPSCISLVELEFQSYNKDDDDFQGFDYSLSGRLSAVRIVFLYRFIQEITEYFMGLATPQVQQMITVGDEGGSIGRLKQQFEIDGAPAVKLHVGLDTPVIIMPRSSSSQDFMQVDLGHLHIFNNFEWYGGPKDDPSAVHMDVLYAEMSGIHMLVGIDGIPGQDMVQEARGMCVKVRRPLRDLLKKVPEVQVDVQIDKLSGILSDKEYLVITDCAATNVAEPPNLPPSFREESAGNEFVDTGLAQSDEPITEQADDAFKNERRLSNWTKARVTVHVQHVELELHIGIERESPLARVEMQGFWLGYCGTLMQEMDVYLTLPNFSVIDLRPDTKPEMRLMFGSMADVESSNTPSESADTDLSSAEESVMQADAPRITMLVMDVRMKQSSQAVVIRLQRPRVLVVVDFLMALSQFFVPSLGAITGQDEYAEDPLLTSSHIRLETSVYEQADDLVCLSSERQLIADAYDVDEFVYDGCGHSLMLNAQAGISGKVGPEKEPLLVIGCGKRLRFKNITIKNGYLLPEVVHLSTDSSYSALSEDGCVLEGFATDITKLEVFPNGAAGDRKSNNNLSSVNGDPPTNIDFILDVQAIAPELTFYDSTKWPTGDLTRREKLLRAKLDVNFMFASKGRDQWIRGMVKGLSLEGGSGVVVLDPLDVQTEYSRVQDRISISVTTSDVSMRLSFNVIRLILRFQEDAILRFNVGGDQVVSRCTHFDRIWVNASTGSKSGQQLAIWRPRAPRGYVILNDCATSGVASPSQAVMAISKKYGRAKKPVRFELIWSSDQANGDDAKNKDDLSMCCIWMPIAPPGYVALGCVAERGTAPPSSSVVHCVHKDLVTSASISDCILYSSADSRKGVKFDSSIWRLENAAGSFFAHHSLEPPPHALLCDLREVFRQGSAAAISETERLGSDNEQVLQQSRRGKLDRKPSLSRFETVGASPSVTGKLYVTTPQLERIWWSKGTDTGHIASIWRPIAPLGHAIVGDCLVDGLEPPGFGILVKDDLEYFSRPVKYLPRMHASSKGMEDAFMWFPVAPAGYVAMGCVTTKTFEKPPLDLVRCVKMNLLNQASLSARPLFSMQGNRGGYSCGLWGVQNQASTFIARPDLKKPPERMAYALAETGKRKMQDNLSFEVKIGRFSTTIFNDLSGLMTPLVNATMTSTTLAAHGRAEALNAVIISTFAASTFNTQLEAWEPLIEPFEGIFKYESYDAKSEALTSGQRVRITAASVVNLNVTSAGLDTWLGAFSAWQKQAAFEQQARRAADLEENDYRESSILAVSSALGDDDLEKFVIENKLGCDLYLKTSIDKFQAMEQLSTGSHSVVRMPPLRLPDKLISTDEMKNPRQFVAVHVSEVREMPVKDDGNGQDYLCALRLAVRKQGLDQQKALPQSARSRCVKPCRLIQGPKSLLATAKWNEVFVFEVPKQGVASLEVVVTNQAARAGKGEAVGVISLPLEEDRRHQCPPAASLWNFLKHATRRGALSHWPSAATTSSKLMAPKSGQEYLDYCGGFIVVSKYFFRARSDWLHEQNSADEELLSTDIGLLFAVNPDGPWPSMRSILPVGTVPKQVNGQQLAVEVTTAQGHKHVNFRSMVMVVNNTDASLMVALCPISRLNSPDGPTSSAPDSDASSEEVFENQRYQPLLGWGNRWPGLPNDPAHWSNRDCTNSTQDFPDIQLPPGWAWSSEWVVDKSGYVDNEGWAYGADYQGLRWPPASPKCSKKSTFDFVRRRRLYRLRQRISPVCERQVIGTVEAGSSIPIPWKFIGVQTELCVQVRPETQFGWGRTVGNSNPSSSGPVNQDVWPSGSLKSPSKRGMNGPAFSLNQLAKTEELLLCPGLEKGHSWLGIDVDPSVVHDELGGPVYDWKLTVHAPLRIENRLPCTADYVIWEKPSNASAIQRQHGVVSPGGSVYVYSADIRRPIYLTWRAQGGWRPEKDTVLISDPTAEDLPSGFWMVHQQSERKLRVSVEHDAGETRCASKTVRIFVPYWLCNDASLPLTYRLVEIEPNEQSSGDFSWLARAAKAAKQAGRRPSHAVNKSSELRKVVRSLEEITDALDAPVMLSLQALSERYRNLAVSSQDNLLSPRLGLSVGVMGSDVFCDAISLRNFEDKMERVELKAVDGSGCYYRLSAFLDVSAERTKVVHLQPHTLFVNRLGRSLQIRQSNLQHDDVFYPNDQPKTIRWQSIWKPGVISICMEGYCWSQSFSVDAEGIMHIVLRNLSDNSRFIVRAEVRNGLKESRFLVIFRHASFQAQYRVENRSMISPICFRQEGNDEDAWHLLLPGSAVGFSWADLSRNRLLEIMVHGSNPLSAQKYSIDKAGEYKPTKTSGGSSKALHVSVFQESLFQVVSVADWKQRNEDLSVALVGAPANRIQSNDLFTQQGTGDDDSDNQFRTVIELAEFGLSIVDHTPEELLYVSVQKLILSYATGLGSRTSRFKLRVDGLQVDNQLALTPMPVLFIPQENSGNRSDFLLKCTLTMQDVQQCDQYIYPYISLQCAPGVAFLVNIHEPILWRLHEMFRRLNLSSPSSNEVTDVAIDPIIRIGLLNSSEIRFKVTLAMSPTQRPRGMLGFWSSLIASLGNTNEMPIRLTPHVQEDVCMRQSALTAAAITTLRNDILSQPLMLLTGVDILGNASSALGHMSKGVAALSMDKKFIRSRQKQEIKANVEDIGDGLREGGEALAKSLFRGVTGILTKPLEGARSSGVEGFVQGVGKGLIGVAAQPMSGVLDFLSKTTEGANATRMKLAAALTLQEQLLRQRLPRVIGGDNILRPYDDYKARGQVLMQLAERGAVFGNIDLFKVRGKYAASDAYEYHYNLPKGKTLMITHRRVILLQHPSALIAQKRPDLMKEPCTIVWDVTWNDLMTLEVTHGPEEPSHLPPSRLIIHLRDWSQDSRLFDSKEIARVVKCHPGTKQAAEIQGAIQHAYNLYGPDRQTLTAQDIRSKAVRKPYSGVGTAAASGAALGLLAGFAAPIAVPVMATFGALIGTAGQAMLETEEFQTHQDTKRAKVMEVLQSEYNGSMPSETTALREKYTTEFKLIWLDKGTVGKRGSQVSIWRPIPPAGYICVGDVVQCSYNKPPERALVYRDDRNIFLPPEGYDLIWRNTESGARDPVTLWRPRPSNGFVAVGCIAVPDYCEPDRSVVCCVRRDNVEHVALEQEPVWRDKGTALWPCSIWEVGNAAQTFLARRDYQSPPPNQAFSVVFNP